MQMLRILFAGVVTLFPSAAFGDVCVERIVVPDYSPLAWSARVTGSVELTILLGQQGQVLRVDAKSAAPMLADAADRNVRQWQFCAPASKGDSEVVLHYEYQLKGERSYERKRAAVVIDLANETVILTTNPALPMP